VPEGTLIIIGGKMLAELLSRYNDKIISRFHMPGHHGNLIDSFDEIFKWDITEVPGYDNLQNPTGIIKMEEDRAAKLFQSNECILGVNGSTGFLVAGVLALSKPGRGIIFPREAHMSLYNGALLAKSELYYYDSYIDEATGMSVGPNLISFEETIEKYAEKCDLCIITSPNYMGFTAPIEKMIKIAKKNKLKILVDEAHGAHFPLFSQLPESAIKYNADMVVQSMHKMLPFPTQLALAHLSNDISKEKIRRCISLTNTTSPSYLLMGMFSKIMDQIINTKKDEMDNMYKNIMEFYDEFDKTIFYNKDIDLMCKNKKKDPYKIILDSNKIGLNGYEFEKILREKFGLQMEAWDSRYVLALSSPFQKQRDRIRLLETLKDIQSNKERRDIKSKNIISNSSFEKAESIYPIYDVFFKDSKEKEIRNSLGEISADFIIAYPPGIPLLCPGEKIEKRHIDVILLMKKHFITVLGADKYIKVLK